MCVWSDQCACTLEAAANEWSEVMVAMAVETSDGDEIGSQGHYVERYYTIFPKPMACTYIDVYAYTCKPSHTQRGNCDMRVHVQSRFMYTRVVHVLYT